MERNDTLEHLRQEQKLGEIKSILAVITSSMVLPLYFLFWLCDIIYAPELKWEFLALRATIIPLALVINYLILRANTLSAAYKVGFAYTSLIGLPISIMVLLLENPATPYYAGLNLVAIGTLTFIPWTRNLFILAATSIFTPYYFIALWFSRVAADYQAIAVNSFFIVSTVVISGVVRMFYERMRYRELSQQLELNYEIERRRQMEIAVIQARDEAVAANESKSSFLANMSHELRTPLNAIIGYSELLQDDAIGDGKEDYVKDLQKIESGGRHLLSLINNVLDISKIESGRMDLYVEATHIASVLENVDSIAQALAEKNRNRFSVQAYDLGLMNTDQTKLQQILLNLVSNACKFTQDGQVSLSAEALMVSGQEWLRFEVADTGIGMTPEQCNKIFQAFVQAESGTTKKYGGTGLGLAISQRFCRMMGGDIIVSSRPEHGTVFTVYLPRDIEQNDQATDDIRMPKERRISVKKIAVLDNDHDRRNTIEVMLIQHRFDLTATSADAAGVQFAQGVSPDVLIYDPIAGGEILKLWSSQDWSIHDWSTQGESKSLFNIPTVLVSTTPDQRRGFAFGFHWLAGRLEVQSRLTDDSATVMFGGRSKSLLLIGNTLSGAKDVMKSRRWIVETADSVPQANEDMRQRCYDMVAMDISYLLQATQNQSLELLSCMNQCDSKIILVADDNHRADNYAGLFVMLNTLMSKSAIPEADLSNLITKLVIKSVRGSAIKVDDVNNEGVQADSPAGRLSA